MKKLLCIGGPAAGNDVEISESMRVYRHIVTPSDLYPINANSQIDHNKTFDYRRTYLRDGDKTLEILFYSDGGRGPIEELLSGYMTNNKGQDMIGNDKRKQEVAKMRRLEARHQADKKKIEQLEIEIEYLKNQVESLENDKTILNKHIDILERDTDTDRNNIRSLLNAVNHVTSNHRHGTKISEKSLDRLSNAQVNYEQREDNSQG